MALPHRCAQLSSSEWREVATNAIYIRTNIRQLGNAIKRLATPAQSKRYEARATMGRLIKAVLVLVVLGFAGLVGYAYLADLAPDSAEVKVPVTLNAD
jgi:hypothetical protein